MDTDETSPSPTADGSSDATAPAPAALTDEQTSGTRPARLRSAAAGLIAAGIALAVGELVAGLSSQLTSPVISVGNRVIDAVPRQVKDFAIETFGTNDKIALLAGIYSIAAVFGLVLGIAASRRFVLGAAGIGVFAAVGVWAAGQEVDAAWWAGAPSIIGAVVGIAALALLLATIRGAAHPGFVDPVARARNERDLPADQRDEPAVVRAFARRGFLKMSGGIVVVGAIAATSGRWLQSRFSAAASREAVTLPGATETAPALAGGVAPRSKASPLHHPQPRLLPHRHQPHRAPDRGRDVDAHHQGHGR